MSPTPMFKDKLTATPEELAVFRARLQEINRSLGHQAQSLEAIGAWGVLGHAYRQEAIERYNRSSQGKQTGPLGIWDPKLYPPGFDVAAFRTKLETYQAQRAQDNLRPKVQPSTPGADRTARLAALAEGLTDAQLDHIEAQGGLAAVLAQHAEVFQQTQAHLDREQAILKESSEVLTQIAGQGANRRRGPGR